MAELHGGGGRGPPDLVGPRRRRAPRGGRRAGAHGAAVRVDLSPLRARRGVRADRQHARGAQQRVGGRAGGRATLPAARSRVRGQPRTGCLRSRRALHTERSLGPPGVRDAVPPGRWPNRGSPAPARDLVPLGADSASPPGLDLTVQFFTTRGFAVASVDYAGSTGYGRAYRCALWGRWGVADAEDCLDAARHLGRARRRRRGPDGRAGRERRRDDRPRTHWRRGRGSAPARPCTR